jgi:hypothetical protein
MMPNPIREHMNLNVVIAKSRDSSIWKALVAMWEDFNLVEFWSISVQV